MIARLHALLTVKPSIIFLVAALLLTSCVSTKKGNYLGDSERARREVSTGSYDVRPRYDAAPDGQLVLEVQEERLYQIQYGRTFRKVKNRRAAPWWILTLAGTGVGIAGLAMAPGCFGPEPEDEPEVLCESPEEKAAVRRATPYLVSGISAATVGLLGALWAYADSSGTPTNDVITEGRFSRTEEAPNTQLDGESVSVRLNGQSVRYTTDAQGRITLDPARDFGIRSVDRPRSLAAAVVLHDRNTTTNVTLDPTEWMQPRFRITEADYRVRSAPDTRGAIVARTTSEDIASEVEVLRQRGRWVRVRLRGQVGWVHTGAGDTFWAVPTYVNPNRLPSLTADLTFQEPSGNRQLDADETAEIEVAVTNDGKGTAYRVRSRVDAGAPPHITHAGVLDFGTVHPGETVTRVLRLSASRTLGSGRQAVTFTFREVNGFEPQPARLAFETRRFYPPSLVVSDVGIQDAGNDGQMEPGELVTVTARVRNEGNGAARDVTAAVRLGDNVYEGPNFQARTRIGTLSPGEHHDIQFQLYANQRADDAPVFVDLSESYGEFGTEDIRLPLPFNKPIGALSTTVVRANPSSAPASGASPPSLSVDIWKDLPETTADNANAVAVVIGIRDYFNPDVPSVDFARRDAAIMRKYLTEVLGYRPENILPRSPDQTMTAGALKTLIRQKLPNFLREGSDVFVYFSGHGAPSTGADPAAYLVPADADPSALSDDSAYRVTAFYEDLVRAARDHDASALTVVLDACFTGQISSGEMLIRQASPLTIMVENPILAYDQATAFTASAADEVANWYPRVQHGMFTYFFLKGLRGAADLDNNGELTVEEMRRYLTDENESVPYWSERVHGRRQVPQVQAQDDERILLRYGN
jgi:hypothetical protein